MAVPEPATVNDCHYAVVVGINRYPGFYDLNFAHGDATEFHKWLLASGGGGVPEANTRLVVADESARSATSVPDAKPTRDHVHQALTEVTLAAQQRLSSDRAAWERSRLYLYVSGHGLAPQNGKVALLMANATEFRLGEYIEFGHYSTWYEKCGYFRELIVFADCCRSWWPDAPGATDPPFATCRGRPHDATTTLMGLAASDGDDALEPMQVPDDPDAARGVFTKALLEGLRIAGDASGVVTAGGLAEFVQTAVAADVPGHKVEFPGDLTQATGIVFGRVVARAARNVTIHFPAGDARDVELCRGDFTVVATESAAVGSWPRQLEDGIYLVRPLSDGPGRPYVHEGLFQVAGSDVHVHL